MSKPPTTTAQAAPKPDNRLVRYFKETRAELRKVSWPTRTQALNLTGIVLIVIAAMTIFLGVLDVAFVQLFKLILQV